MTLHEIAPIIDLDLDRVIALFMGKEEMYLKFLRKFPDNARRLLDELAEAVGSKNHEAIEAAAHGIKGVASNLGVTKVTATSTALMLDVRENTPGQIEGHYEQLVSEVKEAITYIEQLD